MTHSQPHSGLLPPVPSPGTLGFLTETPAHAGPLLSLSLLFFHRKQIFPFTSSLSCFPNASFSCAPPCHRPLLFLLSLPAQRPRRSHSSSVSTLPERMPVPPIRSCSAASWLMHLLCLYLLTVSAHAVAGIIIFPFLTVRSLFKLLICGSSLVV